MDNAKNDLYYAKRILKNIEVLFRYLRGKTQDDLLDDGYLCDAIENRFTKLAEDASRLSKEFKQSIPDVPWTAISSIRNRICHDYDVVDGATLYQTVKVSFPPFRQALLDAIPHCRMNLFSEPFLSIIENRKKVELRLYDDKRRQLKPGELIVFTEKETGAEAIVEITDIRVFPSFVEVYAAIGKTDLGYRVDEVASPEDMLLYYDVESIRKWGTAAIEIRLY